MEGYHSPVLLREILKALDIREGGWYLDATLGDGGHSLEILRCGGKVTGVDVDPEALERAQERFEDLGIDKGRYRLIRGNFRDLKNLILRQAQDKYTQTETKFEGVLFDLGVSSLQLESPKRGFSFGKVGPLDMRMDPDLEVRAMDLINGLNKGELDELFSKLGEEKYSRLLASAVVSAREIGNREQGIGIRTTTELAKIVEEVLGRKGKIHPATKIFQALRIAVNDELNALKEALPESLEVTRDNGHILVTSFHSLEDRIVKDTFKRWQAEGLGRVVTKKPITPSDNEIRENPRSRSAKLRIFDKKVVVDDLAD